MLRKKFGRHDVKCVIQYSRLRFLPPPEHTGSRRSVLTMEIFQSIRCIKGDISSSEKETGSNLATTAAILATVGLWSKGVCFRMLHSPWNSGSVATGYYIEARQISREYPINASSTFYVRATQTHENTLPPCTFEAYSFMVWRLINFELYASMLSTFVRKPVISICWRNMCVSVCTQVPTQLSK